MKKTFTYLLATAALIMISAVVMAQGGLTPFVGSTHEYSVTAADASTNTLAWSVQEGTDGTEYDINSGVAGETLNITWNTAGTYHLQFKEDDGTCSTVKQVTVVVGVNTFDVSTADPSATCNAADGQVNYSGTTATTSVTFTVNMTTGSSGFNPNWEFTFSLTPGADVSINNVTASAGTLSGSGPYTVTGLTSASEAGTVNITMDVTGDIHSSLNVDLSISSATELSYNTPDVDNNDWTASQTINPLPNTSDIATD